MRHLCRCAARAALVAAVLSLVRPAVPPAFGQMVEVHHPKVQGKIIVGLDGKPLLLRGVNLGNWLVPEGYMFKFEKGTNAPRMIEDVLRELVGPEGAAAFWDQYRYTYITQDDIHFLRKSGLNSVRVPFNARLFVSEDVPPVWGGPGMQLLDRLVQWCEVEGMWVIFDMHCAPGGQTGDNIDDSWGYPWLFRSEEMQDRTVELWRRIAEHFHQSRAVLGYDLLNEPIAPFHDTAALNPLLEPLYRRIVSAIRDVDRDHIIFLGGAQWDGNFDVFGPPFAANLAYTFHRYWCDTTRAVIKPFLDFRERYNVPLWLGESGENTDAWINSFRTMLEKEDIGWCFWPYKKPDAPTCLVTFSLPDAYKLITAFAAAPRTTYEEIRTARPDPLEVGKALQEYLVNCRFSKCRVNPGYARALGLKSAVDVEKKK